MRLMDAFVIAFSTYSRIPMPSAAWSEENRRYAMCFFPLVGAAVGLLLWGWLALCDALGVGSILRGAAGALIPLGEGTLIGMGATVIDRAKIGSHCLVGAGALVTGTANIPDRSLVIGSPARAVRPLTAKELAELESAWKEYCEIGTDMERQGLLLPGSAYSPLPRSAAFQ